MNINDFYRRLESLKQEVQYDPYEGKGRHTHCYMIYKDQHVFEVRMWKRDYKQNKLHIHVVNWTMTAGPATIELSLKNIKDWKIRSHLD